MLIENLKPEKKQRASKSHKGDTKTESSSTKSIIVQ